MGSKYVTEPLSGYNVTPPIDDGTVSEANRLKWSTIKTKLPDPIKTQVNNIDTKLVTLADLGPDGIAVNYTTVAGDHQKTIEVTAASVTVTLLAIATAPSSYTVTIKNSSGTTAIVDATGAETIDGSATAITLQDNEVLTVQLDNGGGGYIKLMNPGLVANSVGTVNIIGSAVTAPKLGAGAVTAPALGGGAVTAPALGAGAVTSTKILAGAVDQAAIGAAAVGQSELKSLISDQSVLVQAAPATNSIALTGAGFTMGWFAGEGTVSGRLRICGSSGTFSSVVTAINTEAPTHNLSIRSRYVQASPPYNLGNGDIPLFPYVKIENSTGKILGTSFAVDPHWAYHGKHNITPDRIDRETGKKYKNIPQFIAEDFNLKVAIESGDAIAREVALDKLRNKNLIEIELTDAYKNQDMNLVPHPWMNEDLTGITVIMLDPLSPMVLDLYELHKQSVFDFENNPNLSNLLNDDYIRFDNIPLDIIMPKGVIAVTPRWRNTVR